MNILVVNDDGYNQIGINLLKDKMQQYGNVYVVAPNRGYSGTSMSVKVFGDIKYHKYDEYNYHVEASPADCVKFGLYALGIDFDLVVSGINNGYNLGIDTLYSGTVGAALEALLHQKKSMAFSCSKNDFENAKSHFIQTIDFILKNKLLSDKYCLNINFPENNVEVKGIKIVDLLIKKPKYVFYKKENYYEKKRFFDNTVIDMSKDIDACKNGYITITPLKLTQGDEIITKKVKEFIG